LVEGADPSDAQNQRLELMWMKDKLTSVSKSNEECIEAWNPGDRKLYGSPVVFAMGGRVLLTEAPGSCERG
jgi:hypothetical protein